MTREGEKCNVCRLNDTWIDGRCANCGYDEGVLAHFLLARIAEDEMHAREIANPHEAPTRIEGAAGPEVRIFANPARVLAECEAKRRIVEDAYEMSADSTMYGHGWRLLEFMVGPYADHPDCREEWKP